MHRYVNNLFGNYLTFVNNFKGPFQFNILFILVNIEHHQVLLKEEFFFIQKPKRSFA